MLARPRAFQGPLSCPSFPPTGCRWDLTSERCKRAGRSEETTRLSVHVAAEFSEQRRDLLPARPCGAPAICILRDTWVPLLRSPGCSPLNSAGLSVPHGATSLGVLVAATPPPGFPQFSPKALLGLQLPPADDESGVCCKARWKPPHFFLRGAALEARRLWENCGAGARCWGSAVEQGAGSGVRPSVIPGIGTASETVGLVQGHLLMRQALE